MTTFRQVLTPAGADPSTCRTSVHSDAAKLQGGGSEDEDDGVLVARQYEARVGAEVLARSGSRSDRSWVRRTTVVATPIAFCVQMTRGLSASNRAFVTRTDPVLWGINEQSQRRVDLRSCWWGVAK